MQVRTEIPRKQQKIVWEIGYRCSSSSNQPVNIVEDDIAAQNQVLFPTLRQLREAQEAEAQRRPTNPQSEWSPRPCPYKTFDKDGAESDSDEEEVAVVGGAPS